ncbi:hypothetical protein EXS74_00720 [Candidatus Woesearchaeota archaeon]|nr:hypothetical protein [Candidatus Woesearchaeota archaeon]
MALDICAESFIRFFFLTLRFIFIDHLGWSVTLLLIALILQRFPLILGFMSDAFDFVLDFLKDALVETVIGSLIFGGLGVIFMSIFWTAMALGSRANIFLRLITAPFFFIAGAFVGAFPIPLPGLSILLNMGLKDETFANFVCFAPIVLFVLAAIGLQMILGQGLCEVLNEMLLLLS